MLKHRNDEINVTYQGFSFVVKGNSKDGWKMVCDPIVPETKLNSKTEWEAKEEAVTLIRQKVQALILAIHKLCELMSGEKKKGE